MSAAQACPVCGGDQAVQLLVLDDMPVLPNARVEPADAQQVARGRIELVICTGCTHLYNRRFDPAAIVYDAAYENALDYSPTFRGYAQELAERLVTDHSLEGAAAIEVGCGPGHFLADLCAAGIGKARGFDPSHDPGRLGAPSHPAVDVSAEPLPDDGSVVADLVVARHVLEHVVDPAILLAALAAAAAPGGVVYIEVPDAEHMLVHEALWDLVYEHPSYFSATSLELVAGRAGLAPVRTATGYADQFLQLDARPAAPVDGRVPPQVRDEAVAAAQDFGRAAEKRIDETNQMLRAARSRGRVAMWGAGSKGVTLLNLLRDPQLVDAVVDVNPRKHGTAVPGTGHVIGDPADLAALGPRTVVLTNPIYEREVAASLAELGVSGDLVVLWS